MHWIENEQLFKKELIQGFKWQLHVAKYLAKEGFEVDVPALRIRESVQDIPEFADEPDILWEKKVFEVKSRKIRFNTPDEFPFQGIFVDTVKGWKEKKRKPDGYICVSTLTGSMICLSGKTHWRWNELRKHDGTRNISDWFYEADRRLWVPIEKMVEEMHSLVLSQGE